MGRPIFCFQSQLYEGKIFEFPYEGIEVLRLVQFFLHSNNGRADVV
jgi:hypothetical protein